MLGRMLTVHRRQRSHLRRRVVAYNTIPVPTIVQVAVGKRQAVARFAALLTCTMMPTTANQAMPPHKRHPLQLRNCKCSHLPLNRPRMLPVFGTMFVALAVPAVQALRAIAQCAVAPCSTTRLTTSNHHRSKPPCACSLAGRHRTWLYPVQVGLAKPLRGKAPCLTTKGRKQVIYWQLFQSNPPPI